MIGAKEGEGGKEMWREKKKGDMTDKIGEEQKVCSVSYRCYNEGKYHGNGRLGEEEGRDKEEREKNNSTAWSTKVLIAFCQPMIKGHN